MGSDKSYDYEFEEEMECSNDSSEEEHDDDNLQLGEVELVDPVVDLVGSGHGPGQDKYKFEVLTGEQIHQHMLECIQEVNEVFQNPVTVTRMLLTHFNWDKIG